MPEERLDEIKALLARACNTFVQRAIRVEIRGLAHYVTEGTHDHGL